MPSGVSRSKWEVLLLPRVPLLRNVLDGNQNSLRIFELISVILNRNLSVLSVREHISSASIGSRWSILDTLVSLMGRIFLMTLFHFRASDIYSDWRVKGYIRLHMRFPSSGHWWLSRIAFLFRIPTNLRICLWCENVLMVLRLLAMILLMVSRVNVNLALFPLARGSITRFMARLVISLPVGCMKIHFCDGNCHSFSSF